MRRSAIRELLKVTSQPGMISFAGGVPAPELFPLEAIARASQSVLKGRGRQALQYGETEGVAELRAWIAARFSLRHLPIDFQNVMIVSGSQQALELIGRIFINPLDRVLVENPTYLALLSAWRPLLPTFVPAASDADGMRVDALPGLPQRRPKLVYVVPNFQNPQGTTLSLARRRQLVQWAHGQTGLVEDNPYGDLRYEGEALPHLIHLDATRTNEGTKLTTNVIHVGTFSKVLAPGLRVGWVIAEAEVIDRLVQAKQAADLHTSTFCQHVVLELIRNGILEAQIPKLREAYRFRRDAMLTALEKYFPAGCAWTRPSGGMFLFLTLPGCDVQRLLDRALDRQVAFVPGENFFVDNTGSNTIRLNFSNAAPSQIEEGVKRLATALREQL